MRTAKSRGKSAIGRSHAVGGGEELLKN